MTAVAHIKTPSTPQDTEEKITLAFGVDVPRESRFRCQPTPKRSIKNGWRGDVVAVTTRTSKMSYRTNPATPSFPRTACHNAAAIQDLLLLLRTRLRSLQRRRHCYNCHYCEDDYDYDDTVTVIVYSNCIPISCIFHIAKNGSFEVLSLHNGSPRSFMVLSRVSKN